MLKTKLYNKNYNQFNDNYQLVVPLNLENLIPEDDSVRLLSHILEGLDYKKLYKAYSSVGRKPAVEPKMMFNNAKAIRNMDFAKPKADEIIFCQGQTGIIYDCVEGESLLDWVMRTGDLQECAVYMAKLHKTIFQNRISNVPNYKEFLKHNIVNAPSVNSNKREEVLQILDKLSDGNTLCHGDFHPGNILISNGNAIVIDFMNICHGDFLYDVARTVFLVEYTPVPAVQGDRELLLQFKKTLADLYLIQMNVTREMIQDYLSVIIAARAGECPNE